MRFIYIIILIAAAIFYPLYVDDLSFLLLCALLVLPLLLLVQLYISSARLKIAFPEENIICEKDREAGLKITLFNKSIFPVSCVKIRINTEYLTNGERSTVTVQLPVGARRSACTSINASVKHCGCVKVSISSVCVYDLLKLFSRKIRLSEECPSVLISFIPPDSSSENDSDISDRRRPPECTACENAAASAGNESSDIFGFREFTDGDKLSMIHYKLSSRFDKDYVRIMSQNENDKILLIPDFSDVFSKNSGRSPNLDIYDRIVSETIACAENLIGGNNSVYIYINAADIGSDSAVYLPHCGGYAYRTADKTECTSAAAALTSQTLSPDLSIPNSIPDGFSGIITGRSGNNDHPDSAAQQDSNAYDFYYEK